jgi:hypothetical protein
VGEVLRREANIWAGSGTGAAGIGVDGAPYWPSDSSTADGTKSRALVAAWHEAVIPSSM